MYAGFWKLLLLLRVDKAPLSKDHVSVNAAYQSTPLSSHEWRDLLKASLYVYRLGEDDQTHTRHATSQVLQPIVHTCPDDANIRHKDLVFHL